MSLLRLSRKFLKITLITAFALLTMAVGFHLWFISYARRMIRNLVEEKSHGKLKLDIDHLGYDYFTGEMKIRNAVFYSPDSVIAPTAYRFQVKEIHVKLNGLFPLIFEKKLSIDSIHLDRPAIRVTALRMQKDSNRSNRQQPVSISHEMGKVYNTIQDALRTLKVRTFQLDEGSFALLNKAGPDQHPLFINHINFEISNFKVGGKKAKHKEFVLFSDNVILNSHHQDILFPDGRHRLSFRQFGINLKNQRVEFDSCTISAVKTDSSNAAFRIFFDKLQLIHINFDSLYQHDLIMADTVLCTDPKFILVAALGKNDSASKRARPRLEKVIESMAGNLRLGYVNVHNASFDITTFRQNRPTNFTSSGNNFEMKGFRILQDEDKPVHVDSFAMAIRNYDNFIRDSSYRVQFDSILFNEDKIYLSNFLFNKLDHGHIINSITVPRFYLGGLSWDALVFDHRVMAEQATLFSPVIRYTASPANHSGRRHESLFTTFSVIRKFADLKYLDVADGDIQLDLGPQLKISLQKANAGISMEKLLYAPDFGRMKQSVDMLSFGNGTIHAGDLDIQLNQVHYGGQHGQFSAGLMHVQQKKKQLELEATDASVDSLRVNEKTGDLEAAGIRWKEASLHLRAQNRNTGDDGLHSLLRVQRIHGLHTRLELEIPARTYVKTPFDDTKFELDIPVQTSIKTELDHLDADQLYRLPGFPLELEGFRTAGHDLTIKTPEAEATVSSFRFDDKQNSQASDAVIRISNHGQTSLVLQVPGIQYTPDLKKLMHAQFHFLNVQIDKPVADIFKTQGVTYSSGISKGMPAVFAEPLRISQPTIRYHDAADSSRLLFRWNGTADTASQFFIRSLQTSEEEQSRVYAHGLYVWLRGAGLLNKKNSWLDMDQAGLVLQADTVTANRTDSGQWNWAAHFQTITGNRFDLKKMLGQAPDLKIDSFQLRQVSFNSDYLKHPKAFLLSSPRLLLSDCSGSYRDSLSRWEWHNAGFDKKASVFSLDSLRFIPLKSLEEFAAAHPYEADYISFKTGKITLDKISQFTWADSNMLRAGTLQVHDFELRDFRDKRPPLLNRGEKGLPATLLKSIPLPYALDSLRFKDASIYYAELNDKTLETGTIPVTGLQVKVFPLLNRQIRYSDSLHIQADGYVMDSLLTRLRYTESYSDTMGGFNETVQMQGRDLTLLNPVLAPLSSVVLQSAVLDTLNMRITGNKILAWGEIRLLYHDLKVKFLKNGGESKRGFLKSLETFIANSFVIRNKNSDRVKKVFYIRMRDRSAVNYMIKTLFSGVASSVGARNNRRLMRKYNKLMHRQHLPPVDFYQD